MAKTKRPKPPVNYSFESTNNRYVEICKDQKHGNS